MKITQWMGYNEDASQYILRPGELRVLNNLQSRRPGMLIARKGLTKIYGQYKNEPICGLYRRATTLGTPSDFLWLQKVQVPRTLTQQQIANLESPFKTVWMVRRVIGNQSKTIDTQELSPDGSTTIPNFCIAEDRHGRLFVFYGHGVRPKIYRPGSLDNIVLDMGLDPPKVAPSVTPSGTGYFIESVDIKSGGGSYYAPPDITVTGGSPDRPAKLKAIVQSGNVVGVDVVDGGANYKTPPTVSAAVDKIGTGFRGRGNISSSARTIEGFSSADPATVSVLSALTSTQTFGSTNGTENNSILYRTLSNTVTEKVLSATASTLTLGSVAGIMVGDTVRVWPEATPFSNGNISVISINTSTNTVMVNTQGLVSSPGFVPQANTTYEATFTRMDGIAEARADYDPTTRRFTANIPLSTTTSSGNGAYATLEFSPKPLGYGVNVDATQSVSVSNVNFQTYKNQSNAYAGYLYNEFWEGSDYDAANSVENSRYGGLQASGARRALGYSGAINGSRADVYWPDYSKLSVWFCTGTLSNDLSQWTRADVDVTTEVDSETGASARVLVFRLRPSAQSKQVTYSAGVVATTGYSSYEQLPQAQAPEVKLYLTDCPDSWVTDNGYCSPTAIKENQPSGGTNRLKWWSAGTSVARPIVGVTPIGTAITAEAVTITDPGRGWAAGSTFAFRLYQANPYEQVTLYNTSSVSQFISGGQGFYEASNRYVQFTLTANDPDNLTPHGPPNALISPSQVTIPGSGYLSGTTGYLTLCKRDLTQASSTAVSAVDLRWTAKVLSTLTSASQGQIASVTVLNPGRNYFAAPTIESTGGGSGYGLQVEPVITDGRIRSVRIIDGGLGYTQTPELYTTAEAARLTPVMRPSMRGIYRCAYRFVDRSDTVVATVTATLGDSATTLTLSSVDGVEPDMILDSSSLPHNAKIKSVSGNQVEINQEITGLAANTPISVIVRDMTKPVAYSDLSPIKDVDAGPNDERPHSSVFTWAIPGITPPSRADLVELWRTSADQSLVFYRTEAYGIPTANGVTITGTDALTDEELTNPDRPFYAAMPVVLPNGNVNAYRFGKPRSDMSVAVAYQDRLWMAVSTSGKDANTIFYSEFDEFESTPDVNELPIQVNQKTTDVLTALVPFGSMLLAMQHTHTYSVAFNTDPGIDPSIQMMSHRGCLHQRCWDIHENILYAADESGVYSMNRAGQVKDVSMPIRDIFVSELLDYSKRDTFFLQVDPRTHILRFFCVLKSNVTETPSVALCYDIQAGTWWTESYPNGLTSACSGRPADARIHTMLAGAVDGNMYEIGADSDHANCPLTDTYVSEGGSGYLLAPKVTVPNCTGAVVHAVVSEGRVVDVIIQHAGWDAKRGIQLLTEDGKELNTHNDTALNGVEYAPIPLDIAAPDPGGVQAVAYANFGITPLVVRDCTVAQGEAFVRLSPLRVPQPVREFNNPLVSEASLFLLTESGLTLLNEPPPVEIGMEAIGDYVPLNAFVTKIDGPDIYLAHPDGTPVSMLFGEPRTNEPGTGTQYLELGGTPIVVRFRKPYRTHVPFRMATGFMALANETNVRGGDGLMDRSVTLVYTPTEGDKYVEIIERFNGSDEMRANLMRRDRTGAGGFIHRQDSASTVLNMSKEASPLGASTGVATARFASRVYADMGSADQHLQVELYGRPEQCSPWRRKNFWIPNTDVYSAKPFVMHSLTVNGVVVDAQ